MTRSRDGERLAQLVPALIAAAAFGCADVLTKVTLESGAGVLTMALVRGLLGVPLVIAWLYVGARPVPLSPQARRVSLLIGVLFAGNVYWLFKAIEVMDVPVAILTYFSYPLLTGIAAAATGMERLGAAGAVAALVAFSGLALIVGAHPGGIALDGLGFALIAACSRVAILLLTRARLFGADARLAGVWSMVAAATVYIVLALATADWQPPMTTLGWSALTSASLVMVIGVLAVLISTTRIGPFRAALFMNLEPLIATAGSTIFLGEVITPWQAVGGAVMIAALVAFQLRRAPAAT